MAKTASREPDIAAFRKAVRAGKGGPHFYAMLLGLGDVETTALLARVEAGFRYASFERFQRNIDMPFEEFAALVQITPRTLARRRAEGRLTRDESDRLVRAARVFGKALALFEADVEAARHWFASPAPALADRTPQDVATTDVGAREVEDLIGRLEHGVFS